MGINQWKPQIFEMISITVCDKHPKPHSLMLLQADKLSQVTLMALGTNQSQFITFQWPSSSSCSTTLLLTQRDVPLKSGTRWPDSWYYHSTVLIAPFLHAALRVMRCTGMILKRHGRERWTKVVGAEQEKLLKYFNAVSHTPCVVEVYFLNSN